MDDLIVEKAYFFLKTDKEKVIVKYFNLKENAINFRRIIYVPYVSMWLV